MASEEAHRVSLQAENAWNALGPAFAPARAAAVEEARLQFGPALPNSPPSVRLATAHFLLKQAREAAPAPSCP